MKASKSIDAAERERERDTEGRPYGSRKYDHEQGY